MMRKRKTVVAKRVTPKVMTGIPKSFGILNDPLGNQMESKLMEKEEAEQRRCDRFWGQDKDLHDREIERKLMADEDACSLKTERWHETVAIQKRWDEEYQRNVWFENRSEAKYKEIERREYLKFVNSSLSSEEVIGFVWGGRGGGASSHVHPQESQGLVFSDLSAIGKEVALSLPSAVGALHMSIHLDGLQQSRAIVDEASTAFKQTLRRINTQSADDGDATQPFKTNALAASIISDAKQRQKKTGSPSKSSQDGSEPPAVLAAPAAPAAPVHIPALDGHPLHKWDQELMLQMAFMSLDKGGTGSLTPEEVAAVSFDSGVHSLLSFTVFWATIKKRNWKFFQSMRGQSQSLQIGHAERGDLLTLHDWMRTAQALSFEMAVPLRHLRTQEEHEETCRPAPTPGKRRAAGVGAANVFSGLPEREHRISRVLQEGDCVWALHNGGVMWLPAVVKAVHFTPPSSAKFGVNAHRGTVTYSPYCYDLWYPLSQKELSKARTAMASRQLLALPSQVQAQRVQQEKLMMMRLSAEGAGAGSASIASVANFSKCLAPKPLSDERKVCAYAFDLVDGGGEGVVPLHRLVQCLQSLEFSRVVATSLALSTIFHGGSHAGLHGSDKAAEPQEAGGEKAKKVTAPGSTADIPSLLPVFIDTFSAPAAEEEERDHKDGEDGEADESEGDGGDEDSAAQGGGDGDRSVSEDGPAAQQQHEHRRRARKAKKPVPAAATAAPALDWISKLDFLEFCQAVADIKRYSVVVSQ